LPDSWIVSAVHFPKKRTNYALESGEIAAKKYKMSSNDPISVSPSAKCYLSNSLGYKALIISAY
jgi:hypothetical protein